MSRSVELCLIFLAFTNILADFDGPVIQQITEPVDHLEAPTWDGRKNMLFYVDLHSGRVFSYNYKTEAVNYITLRGDVAPVVTCEKNQNLLIVGLNRSLVALEWDGINRLGKQKILTDVSDQFPGSRFNDGKVDKRGRLWFGTMGPQDLNTGVVALNQGVLYKITKDNLADPHVEIAPVNISNGLAWNAASNKFYFIDSASRLIAEYEFNIENGSISNRRVAFNLKDYPDLVDIPDGMTIDENDNLWVALFGGGSIIQVDPRNGTLLQRIALPARDVTSATWGGPNLDILFVTTSRHFLTEEQKRYFPAAGSVFAITNLKTRGKPLFNADIIDSIPFI